MHGSLRDRELLLNAAWAPLVAALALLPAVPVRAEAAPAPGGEPLLDAAAVAPATAVGSVAEPRRIDVHGWTAELRIERVVRGDLAPGTAVQIGWEELARSRPARFQDGDRVLVSLEPLPGASLWRKRFPDGGVLAVAGGGDAFLRDPDPTSVASLAAFLAIPPDERDREAAIEALSGIVARAQEPLARAAIRRLADLPGLESRASPTARELLAGALAATDRPREVRTALLDLIGSRSLASLRPAVEPLAAPGSALRAAALRTLAALDGGLPGPILARLLDSEEPDLRAVAARYAPGTVHEARLEGLLAADPAPEVRAAAAEALVRARGEQAIGALSRSLFDPDRRVRQAAALGMAGLGQAAVPTLEGLVAQERDSKQAVTPLAALALAGPPGLEALARIAGSHQDERIRALAETFLGRSPRRH